MPSISFTQPGVRSGSSLPSAFAQNTQQEMFASDIAVPKRFRSLLERCCIERKRLCCFLERERRRRDGHLVR